MGSREDILVDSDGNNNLAQMTSNVLSRSIEINNDLTNPTICQKFQELSPTFNIKQLNQLYTSNHHDRFVGKVQIVSK